MTSDTARIRERGLGLKAALIALGAVVAIGGVVAVLFVRGTLGVDDWIVRQVTAIAQTYIVPTMAFESFDYQAPRTVALEGVVFTSPDGTRVVEAERLTLTLAQAPRRGRPIVIERVTIDSGLLRLERDLDDDGVAFKGLVPFVKRDNITQQERVEESVRLSTVLRLEEVRLVDTSFAYIEDPQRPPLRVDGFDLDLDIVESAPGEGEEGGVWHALNAVAQEGDILRLELNGRVNLDTASIIFEDTRLRQRIDGEVISVLPPQVQDLLLAHEARGVMEATLSGRYEAGDPAQSDLSAEVSLEELHFVVGDFRVAADHGVVIATLRDGVVRVDPLQVSLYDGRLDATLDWPLGESAERATFTWSVIGVELERLLRTGSGDETGPSLAGMLRSDGTATASTSAPRSTLDGEGQLQVREGRLTAVPVIGALASRLQRAAGVEQLPTQELDAQFRLEPELVRVESFDYLAEIVAAKGAGTIGYDGALDMTFTGGPIQRVNQSLGAIGDLIGRISEGAVSYRVRGTVGEPSVTVHPLGIGGGGGR